MSDLRAFQNFASSSCEVGIFCSGVTSDQTEKKGRGSPVATPRAGSMKLVYAHGGDGNAVIPKNVDTHGRATIAIAVSGVVVTESGYCNVCSHRLEHRQGARGQASRPPR